METKLKQAIPCFLSLFLSHTSIFLAGLLLIKYLFFLAIYINLPHIGKIFSQKKYGKYLLFYLMQQMRTGKRQVTHFPYINIGKLKPWGNPSKTPQRLYSHKKYYKEPPLQTRQVYNVSS